MKRYFLSPPQTKILNQAQVRRVQESDLANGGQIAAYRVLHSYGLLADGQLTDAGKEALGKGYFNKPLPEWEAEFEANVEHIMVHHQVIRAEAIRIAVREYVKFLL